MVQKNFSPLLLKPRKSPNSCLIFANSLNVGLGFFLGTFLIGEKTDQMRRNELNDFENK